MNNHLPLAGTNMGSWVQVQYKNEVELSPVCCVVSEVETVACGAEFTVWLSPVEGISKLTAKSSTI